MEEHGRSVQRFEQKLSELSTASNDSGHEALIKFGGRSAVRLAQLIAQSACHFHQTPKGPLGSFLLSAILISLKHVYRAYCFITSVFRNSF